MLVLLKVRTILLGQNLLRVRLVYQSETNSSIWFKVRVSACFGQALCSSGVHRVQRITDFEDQDYTEIGIVWNVSEFM
jgi:protein subunit release factor A